MFGKKKNEQPTGAGRVPAASKPDFPLGNNIISDTDIRTFADLGQHYPLPVGFVYRQGAAGAPAVVRVADGKTFSFLIEAGMLTFDEPYTMADGRTGYKTVEVIKRGLRK